MIEFELLDKQNARRCAGPSLFPIKNMVVTSGLSPSWTFLRCNLNQIVFVIIIKDGQGLEGVVFKQSIYTKQVNRVIPSYNHPIIREFRIGSDMGYYNREVIDK